MLDGMTRLLTTLALLAFPHGGQRTARRNALAAQAVTKSLTASARSSTANSLRNVASG